MTSPLSAFRIIASVALAAAALPFAVSAAAFSPAEQTEQTEKAGPWLTGKAAVDRLVGNTMVIALSEPAWEVQEGKLYLRADGTAVWVNIQKGAEPFAVRWRLNGENQLCLDGMPEGFQDDKCQAVEIRGHSIRFRDAESTSEGILTIRLVSGNPFQF